MTLPCHAKLFEEECAEKEAPSMSKYQLHGRYAIPNQKWDIARQTALFTPKPDCFVPMQFTTRAHPVFSSL